MQYNKGSRMRHMDWLQNHMQHSNTYAHTLVGLKPLTQPRPEQVQRQAAHNQRGGGQFPSR